jgi:dihydroxyacid dehydratase/phosphogluconate dehydratase
LVEDGDRIEIDIPNRGIKLAIADTVLAERRKAMEARGNAAWKPASRKRNVSPALKAPRAAQGPAVCACICLENLREYQHSACIPVRVVN